MPKILLVQPRTETQYVTREVHEHRAPTDQSVMLLHEMEAAAEDKRVASIRLEGNDFSAVVQMFRRMEDCTMIFIAKFDLNGRAFVVRHEANDMQAPAIMLGALKDKVADTISRQVLDASMDALMGLWR